MFKYIFGLLSDFFNLSYLLRDIKCIYNIITKVNKFSKTADWKLLNLRYDWIYRIYTIINPRDSDLGDQDEVLNIKFNERINVYHNYIDSIGLANWVKINVKKVEGTQSYLLFYSPLLVWFHKNNIIFLGIVLYLYFSNTFAYIYQKIEKLINLI